MSATHANIITEVPVKDIKTKINPAKNRTDIIKEVFEAIPQIEGFPLTTEQLWEYFEKASKKKDIKLRKLSTKKEDKSSEGPKRLTGYNVFTRDFKCDIPDGIKVMTHKSQLWKKLTSDEQAPYIQKAQLENDANGLETKPKKLTFEERCANWETEFKIWALADPTTRGPEPIMPKPNTRKKKLNTGSSTEESE